MTEQRRRYVAQDPHILEQLITEKQAELLRAQALEGPYAQYLGQQQNTASLGSFATLYEGDEGLAAILRDVIATLTREGTSEYQAISSAEVRQYLYHNFPHFTRERIRHKLFVNVIAVGYEQPTTAELAERRVMRPSGSESDVASAALDDELSALLED